MRNKAGFKVFSITCMILIVLLMLSAWTFAGKKEMVQELIVAEDGGEISLGEVTITFDPGDLTKDSKIHIIKYEDGTYQLGPEIKVKSNITIYFADAPEGESEVETSVKGKEVSLTCTDGYVETDHFSRYRGCWR